MIIPCDIRAGVSMLAQLSARWFHAVTDRLNRFSTVGCLILRDKDDDGQEMGIDIAALAEELERRNANPGLPSPASTASVAATTFSVATSTDLELPSSADTATLLDWTAGSGEAAEFDVVCALRHSGAYSYAKIARVRIRPDGRVASVKQYNREFRI